ncbi:cupin domain-containing protein [Aliibacillus thermotolerans]|uniref:Cupin domain-containing protein n=1 Tax=Aliibacillus thermotolerans TaxID=1834418 RepID=A0ABW0U5Z0_9BACI|nr:cupin domain-containing protein [Aliibacillus thermotolerans]MDA3130855.1 cupin domain-containing protein [Aliibacillus thermotolerans]
MYYGHPYWYAVHPYYMYPQVADNRFIYPNDQEAFRDGDEFDEDMERRDYGRRPYVVNIERATRRNNAYRSALWTGRHLQVTLMSLRSREEIGFERHPQTDQLIKIEQGRGLIQIGDSRQRLEVEQQVRQGDAIMIPAGKWHNLTNIGRESLKLYSIYAPPEHPFGTVQQTKQNAGNHHHPPYHHREDEEELE